MVLLQLGQPSCLSLEVFTVNGCSFGTDHKKPCALRGRACSRGEFPGASGDFPLYNWGVTTLLKLGGVELV